MTLLFTIPGDSFFDSSENHSPRSPENLRDLFPSAPNSQPLCDIPTSNPQITLCRLTPQTSGGMPRWNPLFNNNLSDYLASYQNQVIATSLRSPRDNARNASEPPHEDGFHWTQSYSEFFRFGWWSGASTGQRILGGGIALVSGAAFIGAGAVGGEILLGSSLMGGGAVALHEVAYATLAIPVSHQESQGPTNRLSELIGQARRGLEIWHQDHRSTFDYGPFLLAVEIEHHQPPFSELQIRQFQEQWQNLIGHCRQAIVGETDSSAQAARVIQQLFLHGGLGHYSLTHPDLTDLLQNQGGNCSARSRLIIAALTACGIRFQEPYVLGIENFGGRPIGHLEAVVYNRNNHEVWTLRTGARSQGLEAPLYHPHVLLQAFLRRQRVNSPVPDRELVLAPAEHSPSTPVGVPPNAPTWDDALSFPESSSIISPGPLVQEAYDPPPSSLSTAAIPNRELPSFTLENWPDPSTHGEIEHVLQNPILPFVMRHGRLVFREAAHSAFYNSLPLETDRQTYLGQLFQQEMGRFFQSPEMDQLGTLLSNPQSMFRTDAQTLHTAERTLRVLYHKVAEWNELRRERGFDNQFDGNFRNVTPPLAPWIDNIERMLRGVEERAPDFLEEINRLDSDRRSRLLSFIYNATTFVPQTFSGLIQAVIDAHLADGRPTQDSRREENADAPVIFPPQARGTIEIEFWGNPTSPQDSMPVQTGVHILPPSSNTRRASILRETLIDFSLRMIPPAGPLPTPLYRRWTPEISRVFLALNREGRYDGDFGNISHLILESRGVRLTGSGLGNPDAGIPTSDALPLPETPPPLSKDPGIHQAQTLLSVLSVNPALAGEFLLMGSATRQSSDESMTELLRNHPDLAEILRGIEGRSEPEPRTETRLNH